MTGPGDYRATPPGAAWAPPGPDRPAAPTPSAPTWASAPQHPGWSAGPGAPGGTVNPPAAAPGRSLGDLVRPSCSA
jgi:hypothetical protein